MRQLLTFLLIGLLFSSVYSQEETRIELSRMLKKAPPGYIPIADSDSTFRARPQSELTGGGGNSQHGFGTTNFISKWNGSELTNSSVFDDGSQLSVLNNDGYVALRQNQYNSFFNWKIQASRYTFSIGSANTGNPNLHSNANFNMVIGWDAGRNITTADNNMILGYQAGDKLSTGSSNFIAGYKAGRTNISGIGNFYGGSQAGELNLGDYNFFGGHYAGRNSGDSDRNVAIGFRSGENIDGNYNITLGQDAGKNIIGSNNLVFGRLSNVLGGDDNVAIGSGAGNGVTGSGNVFIGSNSGDGDGNFNVGIGDQTLLNLTTGQYNQAIGFNAGFELLDGENNFLGGVNAGRLMTSGSDNTFLGYRCGYNAQGDGNTFIGKQVADVVSTGSNNILIGNNIDLPDPAAQNIISFGNALIFRDVDAVNHNIETDAKIGIGTYNPTETLEVNGGLKISETPMTTTPTSFSVMDNGSFKTRTLAEMQADLGVSSGNTGTDNEIFFRSNNDFSTNPDFTFTTGSNLNSLNLRNGNNSIVASDHSTNWNTLHFNVGGKASFSIQSNGTDSYLNLTESANGSTGTPFEGNIYRSASDKRVRIYSDGEWREMDNGGWHMNKTGTWFANEPFGATGAEGLQSGNYNGVQQLILTAGGAGAAYVGQDGSLRLLPRATPSNVTLAGTFYFNNLTKYLNLHDGTGFQEIAYKNDIGDIEGEMILNSVQNSTSGTVIRQTIFPNILTLIDGGEDGRIRIIKNDCGSTFTIDGLGSTTVDDSNYSITNGSSVILMFHDASNDWIVLSERKI